MLKFIVCTTIFLRPRRFPEPLLRFICNLVVLTLCRYRLLPVSKNVEAPAFKSWFHSKCLGAFGMQPLPFLRTALSQSRNYSVGRRDFACFANTHTLHNSCCLEQSARRWELFAAFPLKRFRPTSPASQPWVTAAEPPDVPAGAPLGLPGAAELLDSQLCPNPVATRKQVGDGL